jgi:hypothetical protein
VLGIIGTCLGSFETLGCIAYIGAIVAFGTFMAKNPPPVGPPATPMAAPAAPAAPPKEGVDVPKAEPDKRPDDPLDKD